MVPRRITLGMPFFLLALLALGSAGAAQADGPPAFRTPIVQKHLDAGHEALRTGDFQDAERAFRRADRRAHGDSFDAVFGLAVALRLQDEADQALDDARRAQALATTPGMQVAALDLLAMSLVAAATEAPGSGKRLQRLDEAIRSLEAALQLDPRQAKLHLDLAEAAFLAADLDRSEAHYERAVSLGLSATEADRAAAIERWLGLTILETDGRRTTRPMFLEGIQPTYTKDARMRHITGTVVLRAAIDEHGRVTAVEVEQGLPYGLSERAEMVVQGWRFAPATRDGEPIPFEQPLFIHFGRADDDPREKDSLPVPRGPLID